MSEINWQILKECVELIESKCRHYGVAIDIDSVLHTYLDETKALINRVSATPPNSTHDLENAIADKARIYCIVWRLAESIRRLERRNVPKVAERLRDLASRRSSVAGEVEQFFDFEYELYCGAECTNETYRVSFITDNMKRPSRYKKRVEFLIMNKFPAECKHPKTKRGVLGNVKGSVTKIKDRNKDKFVPGIIFVSLDDALKFKEHFVQSNNGQDAGEQCVRKFLAFLDDKKESILAAIQEAPIPGIVFHQTILAYYHDIESLAMPTYRWFLTNDGTFLVPSDIPQLVDRLSRHQPTAESQYNGNDTAEVRADGDADDAEE